MVAEGIYEVSSWRTVDVCNAPIPRIRGRHCNAYT